jgi:hypothetical protein
VDVVPHLIQGLVNVPACGRHFKQCPRCDCGELYGPVLKIVQRASSKFRALQKSFSSVSNDEGRECHWVDVVEVRRGKPDNRLGERKARMLAKKYAD